MEHSWHSCGPGQVQSILALSTGKTRNPSLLLAASSNVAYASPGYLLFERDGTLFAQPFDAEHLQVSGEAVAVAEGIRRSGGFSYATFSVTETSLAYWGGVGKSNSQLIWFNRQGKSLGALARRAFTTDPRLSPDEKQVAQCEAVTLRAESGDLWLLQMLPEFRLRFTFHPK